uniref:Uncharacterized protein n=1 Tax=Oryza sativa subsp. japonica TaxID=39947 RepID=Q2R166_ORYSJ|nr:hypothetical protein LOC_Os11g40189 [Oryza sativa Japonica Group]
MALKLYKRTQKHNKIPLMPMPAEDLMMRDSTMLTTHCRLRHLLKNV